MARTISVTRRYEVEVTPDMESVAIEAGVDLADAEGIIRANRLDLSYWQVDEEFRWGAW